MALIRELGKQSIPCIVIGKKYIQTSRYASVSLKTKSNDDLLRILLLLPQLIKIPLVLLTDDDRYLQLLESNWEQLILHYKIPASLENKQLTDKTTLAKIKNQTRVILPKTFKNYKEIPENGYPIIIKPLIQQSLASHLNIQPKKAYICCSKEEVLKTIKILNKLKFPFLIQELIQGSAAKIYNVLLYRNSNGRIIVGFVSKKLRSFPIGFGTGAAQITEKNDMLIEESIKLMEQTSYVGAAEFEYKFCNQKKIFYLIEVNGRFPLQCSLLHKTNPSFISIIFQDLIKPSKAYNQTLFTENIVWIYF
ncbi:hypothetical protein [Bacillus taeanensis]|uniref:ATP-grasp domain-containing protein n=1 Tax=Bacillus taeanensis TaxID=273032 RepID=A0A366XXB4_9BACI|nr:hypothetical protein [Bacillus taeanensis]RBW69795.1 hypothetical protein DS031_09695 [Bacillus taeanensis]